MIPPIPSAWLTKISDKTLSFSGVGSALIIVLLVEQGSTPPKTRNLILASRDLDVGVFRRQVLDMGAHRPRLTQFISQEDRALRLSHHVAQGGTRLGAIDPSAEHYRRQLEGIRDVTVIDDAHGRTDRLSCDQRN